MGFSVPNDDDGTGKGASGKKQVRGSHPLPFKVRPLLQIPCGRGGPLGRQLCSSKRLYLGLLLLLLLPEIVLYLHL